MQINSSYIEEDKYVYDNLNQFLSTILYYQTKYFSTCSLKTLYTDLNQ